MRSILTAALLLGVISGGLHPRLSQANDESRKLIAAARDEYKDKNFTKAAELAEKAVAADPKDADAVMLLGFARLQARQYEPAVKALTKAIELNPKGAAIYNRRGDAYLKLGKWNEAIADFDKFLAMVPAASKAAENHWRRGIALYYAGKFKEGKEQFELHRTVNPEDVENSAWHYLCTARAASPEEARKALIPVKDDTRVPMAQVLELFAGKLKPQDVIAAAENANLKGAALTSARFYAHLYVALYYESEKDAAKAREHLTTAVEKYKIGDYMWDVANAHLGMLRKKK